MTRTAVIVSVLLYSSCAAQSTRSNEIRLVSGLHLGMDRASIDVNGPSPFSTRPWLASTLEVGASMVHLNRWGLGLLGGMAMNGYTYRKETDRYDVYHATQRLEAQFHWMVPFGSTGGGTLRLGTGLGISFQGNGEVSSIARTFTAVSKAQGRTAGYIAPEITLFKPKRRHSIEIGFRYLRHFDRSPASITTLRSGSSTSLASTSNDHVGLVFRYHLGFKKKSAPPRPVPAIAFEERRTDILTTITTDQDRISIELWDNAEFDGDSISVVFNNEVILPAYELSKKKLRLEIDIPYGINTLVIVARNEGRVPPNTASCIIRRGKGREELLIRTSYEANTAIEIIRE